MDIHTAARPDERPRILIAQPNSGYLSVLGKRIAEQGYRVALADSVQSAIAELYRAPADIVLAELAGPGFCGRELVQIIRDDATLRDLPVLLFTGTSDHGAAVRALRCGADGVVKKPFHFEVLCARIDRELERKHTVEALRDDKAVLDARVVERAIQIGELREQLRDVRKGSLAL